MKKSSGKKLNLGTETLVALQPDALAGVQGAGGEWTKSFLPFACVSADHGRSCSICPGGVR